MHVLIFLPSHVNVFISLHFLKIPILLHVSHVLIVSIWRNFSLRKIKNTTIFKKKGGQIRFVGVLKAFATIIYSKQEFISNDCSYCKFRINNFPPKIGFTLYLRNFCLLTSFFSFTRFCRVQGLKPTVQGRCPGFLISVVLPVFLGTHPYVHVHFRCFSRCLLL